MERGFDGLGERSRGRGDTIVNFLWLHACQLADRRATKIRVGILLEFPTPQRWW